MASNKKKEPAKKAQPAKKPAAKKPAVKKTEPKTTSQSSSSTSTSSSTNTGRYDVAGKYLGAKSPIQLPGGGGMSAQMAAAIQKNPSAYSGYADPSQGTPRYTY